MRIQVVRFLADILALLCVSPTLCTASLSYGFLAVLKGNQNSCDTKGLILHSNNWIDDHRLGRIVCI